MHCYGIINKTIIKSNRPNYRIYCLNFESTKQGIKFVYTCDNHLNQFKLLILGIKDIKAFLIEKFCKKKN